MTEALTLAPALYIAPTAAGALHVVTDDANGPPEHLVRALLREPKHVRTDDADLAALTGVADPERALAVVAAAQDAGWIEGRTEPPELPEGPLGRLLPKLLAPLSDIGQAALVDDQGFSLSSVGFSADADMELSVLAAEVQRLLQRRTTVAASTTAVTGWGLVDHHGAPTVAIFPLSIGTQQFVLIVGGLPRLNHPAFVLLTTALSRRYDPTAGQEADDPSAATTSTGGPIHA